MGYVFGTKTTKWFRFKIWAKDLVLHVLALPSYIYPKPLKPTPLSEEDQRLIEELLESEKD